MRLLVWITKSLFAKSASAFVSVCLKIPAALNDWAPALKDNAPFVKLSWLEARRIRSASSLPSVFMLPEAVISPEGPKTTTLLPALPFNLVLKEISAELRQIGRAHV